MLVSRSGEDTPAALVDNGALVLDGAGTGASGGFAALGLGDGELWASVRVMTVALGDGELCASGDVMTVALGDGEGAGSGGGETAAFTRVLALAVAAGWTPKAATEAV